MRPKDNVDPAKKYGVFNQIPRERGKQDKQRRHLCTTNIQFASTKSSVVSELAENWAIVRFGKRRNLSIGTSTSKVPRTNDIHSDNRIMGRDRLSSLPQKERQGETT